MGETAISRRKGRAMNTRIRSDFLIVCRNSFLSQIFKMKINPVRLMQQLAATDASGRENAKNTWMNATGTK